MATSVTAMTMIKINSADTVSLRAGSVSATPKAVRGVTRLRQAIAWHGCAPRRTSIGPLTDVQMSPAARLRQVTAEGTQMAFCSTAWNAGRQHARQRGAGRGTAPGTDPPVHRRRPPRRMDRHRRRAGHRPAEPAPHTPHLHRRGRRRVGRRGARGSALGCPTSPDSADRALDPSAQAARPCPRRLVRGRRHRPPGARHAA